MFWKFADEQRAEQVGDGLAARDRDELAAARDTASPGQR
jgi:hypothetical protein